MKLAPVNWWTSEWPISSPGTPQLNAQEAKPRRKEWPRKRLTCEIPIAHKHARNWETKLRFVRGTRPEGPGKKKPGESGEREPTQSYGDMWWPDIIDYQEYEVKEYEAIVHQSELPVGGQSHITSGQVTSRIKLPEWWWNDISQTSHNKKGKQKGT